MSETMEKSSSSSSKSNSSEDENGLFAQTLQAVDELYTIRDTYFTANPLHKISKLTQLSSSALQILDSIPPENRESLPQRAMYQYLRGKILDALPHYKKEAEDHLTKAVKLNPHLGDAWLSLGNCIWKKGELISAKNCLMRALSNGPNKKILCQLSMLERKLAQDGGNVEALIEESIKHARQAVALDVRDGYTWYNLGNAFLFSFFVTGSWDHSKIQQSLKAYQNAERDDKMASNPDLYFNCATVNKFLENYEKALSGFETAALKDPGLNAAEAVQTMVQLLDKVESVLSHDIQVLDIHSQHLMRCINRKEQPKARRLASLTSSLNSIKLNPMYKKASVDMLQEGVNKSVALVGIVISCISQANVSPLYYLLCDPNQIYYVLTLYGVHIDAIKEGDQVTIAEPYYRHVDFSWKEKHYQFESVRVDFLQQMLVNGMHVPSHLALRTSILAQHVPS